MLSGRGARGLTQVGATRAAHTLKARAAVALRPHDLTYDPPPLGETDHYSVLDFK